MILLSPSMSSQEPFFEAILFPSSHTPAFGHGIRTDIYFDLLAKFNGDPDMVGIA